LDNSTYNNYRFASKGLDQSTGLYCIGVRYYMPEIGRFITPDHTAGSSTLDLAKPIALNCYNHETDNLLKYVDPSDNRDMTVREVEIVRRIIASAEQVYFSELGKANDQIISTDGSWPDDIAAERMNPVSLEGLTDRLWQLKRSRHKIAAAIKKVVIEMRNAGGFGQKRPSFYLARDQRTKLAPDTPRHILCTSAIADAEGILFRTLGPSQ
jgi:RHS repeat-associated protein